ncbi:P pilus assembly chaperone PapD [Yokenella regensburgei]|nr:P pilus assembly chaperone PapD [Yokenella regensburgei]
MILHRIADGYEIDNPTPYYITVTGLKNRDGGYSDMTPVMIAPEGKSRLKAPRLAEPIISYINDYGGQPEIIFHCLEGICRAKVQ